MPHAAGTFVVEDGTGLANSNSYASTAEFDAYWALRGRQDLTDRTDDEKEHALINATDWIDLVHDFVGEQTSPQTQALEWPRLGAIDHKTERRLDSDEIPVALKNAAIEAAAFGLDEDLLPNSSATSPQVRVKSSSAGPLRDSTEFYKRASEDPVLRKARLWLTRYEAARGFLRA